ncbi:hypothetical protein [Bacteriovorax sp. BSW11_IV]|nr:hypothetical protein [Bacteriovorax sp. BSW11_IV]
MSKIICLIFVSITLVSCSSMNKETKKTDSNVNDIFKSGYYKGKK